MNRILRIIIILLFLNYFQSIYGHKKVDINPVDTIETRDLSDYGINFHVNKITISFSRCQIVNVLDSLIENSDNKNNDTTYYNSYLRLNAQIKLAEQYDIIYDDNDVFKSKSLDSRINPNEIDLLHEICSELIDCGYCRIFDNGKIQKTIIKADVYEMNEYSSTTYIKYYIKRKKYIWTGLPIMHDDFDI
jgi:hypothetical protein